MSLDALALTKPAQYERMGKKAAEELIRADQRVLGILKSLIIDIGESQLHAKTGYTNENLPDESPTRTDPFELDGIEFHLITDARVTNPKYQEAFDQINLFLDVLLNDWRLGVTKKVVRPYEVELTEENGNKKIVEAPFVEWHYLMQNVLRYLSGVTKLGVENKFESIKAPSDLDKPLEGLLIPTELMREFDINKRGAAKIWYLARKFYNEVTEETVEPVKQKMAERTGITVEELPKGTREYIEQFEGIAYRVQSIPSPRRQPGKAINRLYLIPKKSKPKGSKALPIIPTPKNYIEILEGFKDELESSLKRWKSYDGKIGELVVFYYGKENNPRVLEQIPFLPEYQLKRDRGKMFVYIQALHDWMKALERDYVTNRLIRRHSQVLIA